MSLLARIKINPAICSGHPSIGLHTVESLLELLREGRTHDEILAHYEDLEEDDLLAVDGYALAVQYQGSITLGELARQADAWSLETTGHGWPLEHICQYIHATGPLNHHLALPRGQHLWQLLNRSIPLSGDEPVFGQFLVLTDLPHDGYPILEEFIDHEDIVRYLVDSADNSWLGDQFVFESGVLRRFRTHYTDFQGVRKLLDKATSEPYPEDWEDDRVRYRDVEIEWLHNASQG